MAGEAGRGHHSLSCSTGEEVDHAVLCCKVQPKRFQIRQELRGFACQAFEGLAFICHNHLQIQIGSFQLEPSDTNPVFVIVLQVHKFAFNVIMSDLTVYNILMLFTIGSNFEMVIWSFKSQQWLDFYRYQK